MDYKLQILAAVASQMLEKMKEKASDSDENGFSPMIFPRKKRTPTRWLPINKPLPEVVSIGGSDQSDENISKKRKREGRSPPPQMITGDIKKRKNEARTNLPQMMRESDINGQPVEAVHSNADQTTNPSLKELGSFKKEENEKRMSQKKESDSDEPSCPTSGFLRVRLPIKKRIPRTNEHVPEVVRSSESDEKISKKRKTEARTNPPAELPLELKRKIEEMEGCEVKLVIEKQLYSTDLSINHSRFSIPENQIRKEALKFVREDEEKVLEQRDDTKKRLIGMMPVLFLDPCLRQFTLSLRKWQMKRSAVYNLVHWNLILQHNHLKPQDMVQLWSFRSHDNLCFALVKL